MIELQGKYFFSFSMKGVGDFILPSDLITFQIIEEAGNLLPVFKLAFDTNREEVFQYFHEDNKIDLSFGVSSQNLMYSTLRISHVHSAKIGSEKRRFLIKGFYHTIEYHSNTKISTIGPKNGEEAMTEVALRTFNHVSKQTSNCQGSMNWIQTDISDRSFVNQIWMHSYYKDSFPMVGISTDGTFILKDMKTLASKEPDWRFLPTPYTGDKIDAEDPLGKSIIYDGDYSFQTYTGFMNSYQGVGRNRLVHNTEKGFRAVIAETVTPSLSLLDKIPIYEKLERRFDKVGFWNDNVDVFYIQAELRNAMSLAIFSSVKLVLSFMNQFKPIRLLDLALFRDISVINKGLSEELHSGHYVVTKVVRTLSKTSFLTIVEMSREALLTRTLNVEGANV